MSLEAPNESLRDAHKALTRRRILDAALQLVEAEDPDSLTLAHVARAAGVTERTIYRHFATREDLISATWARINETMVSPQQPDTPAGLIALPKHMFPSFDAREALIRAIIYTKQGRDLRMSGNSQRKTRIRRAVREARPELSDAEATRLSAVVQLLSSSFAWSVMKDYWSLDGEVAGQAASEAIARLLAPQPKAASRSDKNQGGPK
jgi:AcrR family transcriptional regulator